MRVMVASSMRGALNVGDNVGSSSGTVVSASLAHDCVQQELGMLLKSQSNAPNQRDAGSYRSGSAPPSFEGALALMGGALAGESANWAANTGSDVIDSEQELRSDPAYLAYYYSNINRNPRLPPPILTEENYLLAQRLTASGLGDRRKLRALDDNNGRSLFAAPQVLPTHNEEPESFEDERSPMANLLQNVSSSRSGKVAAGPPGFSGPNMGSRQRSLVDLIQVDDVINETCGVDSQYADLHESSLPAAVIAELNASSIGSRSATPSAVLTSRSATPNPLLSSRSATPKPALNSRSATPNPAINHLLGSASSSGQVAKMLASDSSVADVSLVTSGSGMGIPGMKSGIMANVGKLAVGLRGLSLSGIHGSGSIEQQGTHTSVKGQHEMHPSSQHHLGSQAQQAFPESLHYHQQLQQFSGLDTNSRDTGRYAVPNSLQPGAASNAEAAPAAVAATMSYMATNPYYQNMQAYGLRYGMGGFSLNPAIIPALMANYPNPLTYDSTPAVSTLAGQRGPVPGLDMHPFYRYASQAGSSIPSYLQDPLYYQYLLQHSSTDSLELQRNYLNSMLGFSADKSDLFRSAKGNPLNPLYYGNPSFVMPFAPLISSPVLPGSPIAPGSFSPKDAAWNYRFASGIGRTSSGGSHMSWYGQKMTDSTENKGLSLLEELKSNKTRKFELADILGHVVEFSTDQHGSRFIQQKLEMASLEEKAFVFEEVLPHAFSLMTDVFGNYVIQKFFEHGTSEQRSQLVNHLIGNVLNLSLQMYGCRVIQKALEVVRLEDQISLISELDGHIMRCIRDQNGNHVIQKCIECVPPEHIDFILSSFHGQVVMLSTHPYGCRVIQRVLEHCTDDQKQHGIMEEILSSVCTLAQDQYGNYVVQHILEHGKPHERSDILKKLAGQIIQMSQHKFASNVVEKCLEFGGSLERQILITEMLGQTEENEPLQAMMKDQYANYVVQKVLETSDDEQREMLLSRIKVHLHALRRYTYGKHIVARVEKLIAVGERHGSQAT